MAPSTTTGRSGPPTGASRVADIGVHLDCWQGADDELLPMVHAQRLVASLPHAELQVVDGSGHFIPAQPDRLTEVLRTLIA